MHPDWLGNPQHFVAGALLAAAVAFWSPRIGITNGWIAAAMAIGVTMAAEAIVELVEYPLRYSDDPNLTAYFDTLSDLASSLAGACVGVAGVAIARRFR